MKVVDVAAGRMPADLVLKNARLINVRTGDVEETSVAVAGDRIAGIGEYSGIEELDLGGLFLSPGFIEGHIHIESSMMTPVFFTKTVVYRGTTTVIADPHEIANVLGIQGIEFMVRDSENLPVDIFYTAPSCVPATDLETAGAKITPEELKKLKSFSRIVGLGEMMNFPGIVHNIPEVISKLGIFEIQDGHAPLLKEKDLNAYISAGIYSDHECTEAREAIEKVKKGMHVMIREGTAARNLVSLVEVVNSRNWPFFSFVSDDRHPSTFVEEGHLDGIIKKALDHGMDLVTAIRLVTINTAGYFRLHDRGEIVPGKLADMVAFDENLNIEFVVKKGRIVVKNGALNFTFPEVSERRIGNFNIKVDQSKVKIPSRSGRIRVIRIIEGNLLTEQDFCEPRIKGGYVVSDPQRDIIKLTVWERHRGTGNVGVGFVRGFGIKRGAIGSTVAHDSHNVIVAGVDDEDILYAVDVLKDMGGGLVVVEKGKVLASLALPVAGLMADREAEELASLEGSLNQAYRELGGRLKNPFMQLSFLALPVIPRLKLTDIGLIEDFRVVDVFT